MHTGKSMTGGFDPAFYESALDAFTANVAFVDATGEILAVPDDLYSRMGLATAISPLRIRGGTAILGRLKRQIR